MQYTNLTHINSCRIHAYTLMYICEYGYGANTDSHLTSLTPHLHRLLGGPPSQVLLAWLTCGASKKKRSKEEQTGSKRNVGLAAMHVSLDTCTSDRSPTRRVVTSVASSAHEGGAFSGRDLAISISRYRPREVKPDAQHAILLVHWNIKYPLQFSESCYSRWMD